MSKSVFAALASVCCLLAVSAPLHAQLSINEHELAVYTLINQHRTDHGLQPLAFSPGLTRAAQFHSGWMATHNCFSHQCGLEPDFGQRLRTAGYAWQRSAGEIIAAGLTSAGRTFLQWVNSPSHNANMLDPRWTAMGVSRVYDSRARYRWYWTVDFGDAVDADLLRGSAAWAAPAGGPAGGPALSLPGALQGAAEVRVQVYDLTGRTVYASGWAPAAGLRWSALDAAGARVPNGVYLVALTGRRDGQVWRGGVQKLFVLR